MVVIIKWEICIEQLEFINKKLFYFFEMTQQQYLTNYRMIYGKTDGNKHLKWILTRRLGIVKLLTEFVN